MIERETAGNGVACARPRCATDRSRAPRAARTPPRSTRCPRRSRAGALSRSFSRSPTSRSTTCLFLLAGQLAERLICHSRTGRPGDGVRHSCPGQETAAGEPAGAAPPAGRILGGRLMLGEDVDAALWLRSAPQRFNVEAQDPHLGAAEAGRSTGGASSYPTLRSHASLSGLAGVEPQDSHVPPVGSFRAGRAWLHGQQPAPGLRSLFVTWGKRVEAGAPP